MLALFLLIIPELKRGEMKQIQISLKAMSLRQHFIYWLFPLLFICSLALAYFTGPRWLQNIVAPPINREFGLQENLEHLLILFIVLFSFLLFAREKKTFMKFIFLICFAGAAFLFLEEIDYGYHFINYYKGISPVQDTVIHNYHNREKPTINRMMKLCYIIMAVAFVILPYIKKEKLPTWLQQLAPSSRLQFTVFILPLVGRFPLVLHNMNFVTNGSLDSNLSEFEEMGIYYIFLLYFIEMYIKVRVISRASYINEITAPDAEYLQSTKAGQTGIEY